MNIFKAIGEFFKRGFRSTPKLPAPEEKTTRIGGLKSDKGTTLKEDIKYNPNLSYISRLSKYINQANTNPNVFKALSSEDLEKLLVGAVLEQKGASNEFMKLYTNCELFSADPKYWESHLNSNFKAFLVPESYYDKTLEGIQKRINELSHSISRYHDAKTVGNVIVSATYEDLDSSLNKLDDDVYRKPQTEITQTISLVPNGGESIFKFRKKTFAVTKYLKKRNRSKEEEAKSPHFFVNHSKYLSQSQNGNTEHLIESFESNLDTKNGYYYEIRKNEDIAEIYLGPDKNSINTETSPLYVQAAQNSILNTKNGLGWFAQNDNARRLFEGQISVEQLKKELDKQGLSTDSNDDIEPNN